ncbi:MAG: hypothetical protein JST86_11405 [Bacteroidetes bacterium]|nr:hypothetical protein [Bacteroidota bacterium]
MHRGIITITILFCLSAVTLRAQDTLPSITVKNLSGQIVVSWVNNYKMPVANISIQRSYDSLKNYTTIGSVLNPQNAENGYADVKPPYNKMYYRVFVSFEGGTYQFSKVARPYKEYTETIWQEPGKPLPGGQAIAGGDFPDTAFNPLTKGRNKNAANPIYDPKHPNPAIQPKTNLPQINTNTEIITYPSRRIFIAKDNNVVIVLPDAETKKYSVKFFEENETPLFEITKVREDYLILDKVNFVHAGWFYFEVFDNGKLIEKNKLFIPKDAKLQ